MAKAKRFDPTAQKAFEFKQELDKLAYLPFPTYFFEIGDEVQIGNLEDVFVVNIFEDGKLYEIDYTFIDNNYGNPIRNEHKRGYVTWLEIRPLSSKDNGIIFNEDLQLHYSQRDIMGLLGNLYNFRGNLNPDYQRGYVWTLEDDEALIDSIFNNIDIGKFVWVKLPYSKDGFWSEILDGKQRMRAIASFYENRFSYNGLYFNDLSHHEKYHFKNYHISYAELNNISMEQKLRYFLTLNRTGKVMDNEHLSKVQQMLENL